MNKQEPVAWLVKDAIDGCWFPTASKNSFGTIVNEVKPLYTEPPKREWVGLTDDEVWDAYEKGMYEEMWFARAIEAKLKEKNHD